MRITINRVIGMINRDIRKNDGVLRLDRDIGKMDKVLGIITKKTARLDGARSLWTTKTEQGEEKMRI